MTTAYFLPAFQVGLRARPDHLGCGCGVGGHRAKILNQTPGGWGGQPPPLVSWARSVSPPKNPTIRYLRFAQMIYRQAGTPMPHPVTGVYIFKIVFEISDFFLEWGSTKVLCLSSTIMGFPCRPGTLIMRVKGGTDHGKSLLYHTLAMVHRVFTVHLASSTRRWHIRLPSMPGKIITRIGDLIL